MPRAPSDLDDSLWKPSFRRTVVAWIVGLTVMVLLYRWLVGHRLEQTSALFLGLPTALACTVALLAKPRSATASMTGFTVIVLLASGPLLGEGFVCVLMAAPLALLVALCLGTSADRQRRRAQRREGSQRLSSRRSLAVALPLLLMSAEGVTEELSFERAEVVVVEQVVDATAAEVQAALAGVPNVARPLPAFLRLGFPRPVAASGTGLAPGDERRIRFAGGEGEPGDLLVRVAARRPGEVVFLAVEDDSHIAHWLAWKRISVRWSEDPVGGTRVTWEARYDRLLDPAWYFGPLERFTVGLAIEHLHGCLVVDALGHATKAG